MPADPLNGTASKERAQRWLADHADRNPALELTLRSSTKMSPASEFTPTLYHNETLGSIRFQQPLQSSDTVKELQKSLQFCCPNSLRLRELEDEKEGWQVTAQFPCSHLDAISSDHRITIDSWDGTVLRWTIRSARLFAIGGEHQPTVDSVANMADRSLPEGSYWQIRQDFRATIHYECEIFLDVPTSFTSMVDTRLEAYFWLTTLNTFLQAFIFEDWSRILVSSVAWRLGVLTCLHLKLVPISPFLIRIVLALPLLGDASYWFQKMPFTWESDLWCSMSDVVVAIWLLLYGASGSSDGSMGMGNTVSAISLEYLTSTIHEMFASFYTAAGFWKINTSFLNPTSSCATVFFSQHIAAYLGPLLSWEKQQALAEAMAPMAPMGTIAIELSMGLVLAMGRWQRRFTHTGLLIILHFHLAVCITPEPNNISLFAVQCVARLVILLDPLALRQVASELRLHSVPLSIATTIAVSIGVNRHWMPLNWSFLAYVPTMAFLVRVISIETSWMKTKTHPDGSKAATKKSRRPKWTFMPPLWAFFYSFGIIMLGAMEEASCNMFANLKIHGGGNHLLLPTGLLFQWFREAGDAHPYGGGEIRLEATDSDWLVTIYPNDLTHMVMPPSAPDLLHHIGAPKPNFFNCGANRVLGMREKGWVPPPPHGMFLKYTVPSLEWKRVLSEAMSKDKSFSVTYSHLPGSSGDETWRATAFERRVRLEVKDQAISKCSVQLANGTKTKCQTNELPYNLDVPWWIRKIGLYHGYPILYNSDGTVRPFIQCFGP